MNVLDRDFKDIWWEKVPAAMQCIDLTKTFIQERKSVAFYSTLGEWTDSYLNAVIRAVTNENYDIGFDDLDLSELSDSNSIIDEIADRMQIGYMKQRKISELMPELPLGGSVWIFHNVNSDRQKELEKLLREVKESNAPLMFLFQRAGEAKAKGFENLSLAPTRLDLSYFAWTILLGNFPANLIEYGAELAVELSEESPVRCACICQDMHDCMKNPLGYCSDMKEALAISKVHTAQVRTIEPLIECGRFYVIDLLKDRISEILPFTDEYGTQFTKPIEVELRNLIYYSSRLRLSPGEYKEVDMLYRARNKISHLELLTYEEILALIQESAKWGI